MRRAVTLIAVVMLGVSGCSRAPQVGKTDTARWEAGDWIVGEPVHYANLTIFPLLSKTPQSDDRYITLDEGLKAGTVEIMEMSAAEQAAPAADASIDEAPVDAAENIDAATTDTPATSEVSQSNASANAQVSITLASAAGNRGSAAGRSQRAGNQVNTLMVVNRSDRPLYLMPGEIVVGGDQDRTIGQELVVQPDKRPVPIDVFCVEHGRWNGRSQEQYQSLLTTPSNSAVASPAVADHGDETIDIAASQANSGKFVASVGSVSKDARLAVMFDADQSKVWKEVAEANGKSGNRTDSGAFTSNYSQAGIVRRFDPYLEKLQRPIADTDRVVGVVVAVNGSVESFDAFESTPLFKKLWPKLLKSAAFDAANGQAADSATSDGAATDVQPKACSREAAQKFVLEVLNVPVVRTENKGTLAVCTRSSDRVMSYRADDEKAKDASGNPGLATVHAGGGAF